MSGSLKRRDDGNVGDGNVGDGNVRDGNVGDLNLGDSNVGAGKPGGVTLGLARTLAATLAALGFAAPASAVLIDNDVPAGTIGQFEVDVLDGGDSRTVNITAQPISGGTVSIEVVFDYFAYVDVGAEGGGVRLADSVTSAAVLDGDDVVVSHGSFTGEFGNTIAWTATSSIPDGTAGSASTMTTTYSFSAETGQLGRIRLLQYLDEDVQGAGNDVFFTRGGVATANLELVTVDNASVVGVSHGGGFSAGQGLLNSSFVGYAADVYNQIKPSISGAGQPLSPTGVIQNLAAFDHPDIAQDTYGPADIVSVMAWDVDPEASNAMVVTTLGGIPDITEDLDSPICGVEVAGQLIRDGDAFYGSAYDDGPFDTGIASVEIVNPVNLQLYGDGSATPSNPLLFDPTVESADFAVVIESTLATASGTVRVTDDNGNMCEFTPIATFGSPIVYGPFATEGWPEAIQLSPPSVGEGGGLRPELAYLAKRRAGVDIDDIVDPSNPVNLSNFLPNGNCDGLDFFADEIELVSLFDVDAVIVSGGECGALGVQTADPENPLYTDKVVFPGGEAEETAVVAFGEGENDYVGFTAAWGAGLQSFGCDSEECNDTVVYDSIGAGDPAWGYALAVWIEPREAQTLAYVATTEGLQIVDVSDPMAMVQLGSFDSNPTDIPLQDNDVVPQDVVVAGNHAYVPVWIGGLKIIDVSNPALPFEVQTIPTDSAFFKVEISTVDDRVFATEGLEGLAVFRRIANGSLLRDRQIPIGVDDERCSFDEGGVADVCWAWAVDEQERMVGVTYGIWPSEVDEGGYVLVDQQNTVACGLIGIEPFLALAPWLVRRMRRRRS